MPAKKEIAMEKMHFQSPIMESDNIVVLSEKLIEQSYQLMKQNQELEYARQEKNKMMANIFHDLRAPISAIRNALDLYYCEQLLSESDKEATLNLINHKTKNLENILQDIYTLFTLEDTNFKLKQQTIPALPFFEEYFYVSLLDTRYKNRILELNISTEENLFILIDIQKMIRVLDNLFINAVKYSHAGDHIQFSVQPLHNKKNLEIKVTDTGIGIPSECLPKIFDRTYTVPITTTSKMTAKSGLGLSIVQSILQKHNGVISCESQPGKGTCFTILLPLVTP